MAHNQVVQLSKYRPAPLNPKRWREAKALEVARAVDRRFRGGTSTEAWINEFARNFLPVLMEIKRNPIKRKQGRKVRHA